jgi:hypothetical protein
MVFDPADDTPLYVATSGGLVRYNYNGGTNFKGDGSYFIKGSCRGVIVVEADLVRSR